jgi:tetratricopeptide (TPR) repeat protein
MRLHQSRSGPRHAARPHRRAIADYDQAIRLDPDFALAYNNRGDAWNGLGNIDRAMADFDAAIKADPSSPSPTATAAIPGIAGATTPAPLPTTIPRSHSPRP